MRGAWHAYVRGLWSRHRLWFVAIDGLTSVAWCVEIATGRLGRESIEPTFVSQICGPLSLVLLLGVLGYTESRDGRLGVFPRRLFTLPMSSVTLVSVPMLAGVIAVGVWMLLWMVPLHREGPTSTTFVALMLMVFAVVYQGVMWSFEALGAARLVIVGVAACGLGLATFAPSNPGLAVSELTVGMIAVCFAGATYVWTCVHVGRARFGGGEGGWPLRRLAGPSRTAPFGSPLAAQQWFEWRQSGWLLPTLTLLTLIVVIVPLSLFVGDDPRLSRWTFAGALALPVGLAVPVGFLLAKPAPGSLDLQLPPFTAVRPLASKEWVGAKVRVAFLSALLACGVVWMFIGVWQAFWALPEVRPAHQWTVFAPYDQTLLVGTSGVCLTWRFLVAPIWIGLSGRRWLFNGAVIGLFAGALVLLIESETLYHWLTASAERANYVGWGLAGLLCGKALFAAVVWGRGRGPSGVFVFFWVSGATVVVACGALAADVVAAYVNWDVHWPLVAFAALLMPVGRIGLANLILERERHA